MKPLYCSTLATLLLGAFAFFAPFLLSTKPAAAQSEPPVCPSPASQEFLLLVRGQNEAERAEIASILPVESTVLICRYFDEVLVRSGGYTNLETVNAWASYMTSEAGYESFVIRPTDQPTAGSAETSPEEPAPATETASATAPTNISFDPVRLSAGYAVLVDYDSRPEIAATVSQLVSSVGLAVYQQRPYLLATYSESEDSASAILQKLSDAQLPAVMVDARDVVRLAESVAVLAN